MNRVIDIKELKKIFRLVDGKIEKIHNRMRVPCWKEVVNKKNGTNGYCLVCFNGKIYKYHVILWTLYYNENIPEGFEIDHINGNRIDNRIENLRLVTHRANCQNLKCHREGKIVGGFYDKSKKKYRVQIGLNNNNIHLGYYKTAEEAHKVYETACNHIEEYVDSESFRYLIQQDMIS